MKSIVLLFTLVVSLLAVVPSAEAGRAAHFRGVYDIVSEHGSLADEAPYFLLDNDTLGVIWGKYAEGPLPPDLEQYRNEQAIIAGFSHRTLLFFGLERGALIGSEYMAMEGGPGEKLELKRRPDGQYDMVAQDIVRVGGSDHHITTTFLLAAPGPFQIPIDSSPYYRLKPFSVAERAIAALLGLNRWRGEGESGLRRVWRWLTARGAKRKTRGFVLLHGKCNRKQTADGRPLKGGSGKGETVV